MNFNFNFSTYSSKTLRRSIFLIGFICFILLGFQSVWNVAEIMNNIAAFTQSNSTDIISNTNNYSSNSSSTSEFMSPLPFIDMWLFEKSSLADSSIWFNALVQVIYSTGIGFGIWPVVTGKFLYKGDAVRTSMVYMFFNIFTVLLSVTFFMTQFSNPNTQNATIVVPELIPFTAIYDKAITISDPLMSRLVPGLAYLLIVLVSIISIATSVYTSSRFIRRHPNYIMSLVGLIVSIAALLCPNYLIARLLDTQIVGILIICSLIFDILSITWIYGAKNIYTDLEFSIGRPILKTWVFMWCITPILLAGLLAWWCSLHPASIDLIVITIPRWTPIVFSLTIIFIIACAEVYKQVDYNCCSMIQEAAQSAKDWGPADPIVRHAWKQWRSVCEDTGQKDFTLRRRGTRDYTHSIKKGQYSRNNKYNTPNMRKASTGGSSSPNYSGSIFDDSAIEEDVGSVDKYPDYQPQRNAFSSNSSSGNSSNNHLPKHQFTHHSNGVRNTNTDHDKQKQYFYVQAAAGLGAAPATNTKVIATTTAPPSSFNIVDYNNVSKVEILSPSSPIHINNGKHYPLKKPKNPMARSIPVVNKNPNFTSDPSNPYGSVKRIDMIAEGNTNNIPDHICWRKFSVNSEEFSTEL